MTKPLRIVYAGDRDISVWVLQYLLERGVRPSALLVSHPKRASHAETLRALCDYLPSDRILIGTAFRKDEGLQLLRALDIDYIVSIHFPYIFPKEVLQIPRTGVLNLHPAYLPYNRGWHTPSWAILEDTLAGATLHFMDEGIDTGDIIHQLRVEIQPDDTADSLYKKIKRVEFDVFREAWPWIESGSFQRHSQDPLAGTTHRRQDLYRPEVQSLDLKVEARVGDVIKKLRALTTNKMDEAAYFEVNGQRYRIQVRIVRDDSVDAQT